MSRYLKLKIKPLLALIFICYSLICSAQNQASKWFFGENLRLHFSDNSPPLVLSGNLNTLEGCASISDSSRNLLFYSDGSTVWSRNDEVMPNGTDLLGDESSTQSAIIVPNPGNPNIYYLFTVGSTIVPSGFHYYTVDLSLNNGFGDIVGNAIDLTDGNDFENWSEKISAVQGGDCSTYWVVSFVDKHFYSYKVTEEGVDVNNPVISSVDFSSLSSRGYLKISPNGKKIAIAHQGINTASTGAFLYSFNNITGEVTNDGIRLFRPSTEQPYGVEFSSQGNKLYISTIDLNDDIYSLYQFDLNSGDIANSDVLIHTEQPAYRGALQLGPDYKIYVTIPLEYTIGTNYLDVINNPEENGTSCDFEQDYIFFGLDSYSMQGLPPFIQSFFYINETNIVNQDDQVPIEGSELAICYDADFTLEGPEIIDAEYIWTFNDDSGSLTVFVPTPSPPHLLTINGTSSNTSGTYYLTVSSTQINCETQFIGEAHISYTDPPIINAFTSLFSCDLFDDDATDGLTTFNLQDSANDIIQNLDAVVYFYLNDADADNDDQNQNALPNLFYNTFPNQILTAKVFEVNSSCYTLGKLQLYVTPSILIPTSNMQECDSGNGTANFNLDTKENDILLDNALPNSIDIIFYDTIENAVSNIGSVSGLYESSERTIYFYAVDNGLCYGSGTFNLIIDPPPPIDPSETTLNVCHFQFPLTINSSIAYSLQHNYTYEWSSGQTTNEIIINDQQTVTVIITNRISGCQISRTYNIIKISPPVITDVDVTINDGTVTVYSPEDPDLTYALDNLNGVFQNSNVFLNVAPGTHTVYVSNACGISEEYIYVLGFPKFFTPNNDGANDVWQVKGVDRSRFIVSNLQIINRFGKLLKTLSPDSGWNGTYNGKKLPASDYWFTISITDLNQNTKTYKGHFSLLR